MKKFISFIVIIMLISNFMVAYANSGPVVRPSYPSSNMITIEENSPIEVINENLTFDFNNVKETYDTINSNVTAEYKMYNPKNEVKTVKMAFPLAGNLRDFSEEDIIIKSDDNILPFEVFIGEKVKNHRDSNEEEQTIYNFNRIVSTINNEIYKPKNFDENGTGKLYKIHVEPKAEGVNLSVDFDFDLNDTKIMTKGFNRFERSDTKVRVASGFYKAEEILEIFVLGKDIELNFNTFKDGSLTEKTDMLNYEVITENINIKKYLPTYIDNGDEYNYSFNDLQLYNMYLKSLDDVFLNNLGFCSEDMLTQEKYANRCMQWNSLQIQLKM